MEWISIHERMPEEYEEVLICGYLYPADHNHVCAGYWRKCAGEIIWFEPGAHLELQYFEDNNLCCDKPGIRFPKDDDPKLFWIGPKLAGNHRVYYWMPYPKSPRL